MTKKEFYSLIDEFINAGYDENAKITLKWTSKPNTLPVWYACDPYIDIEWGRDKWYDGDKSGYDYFIVFKDRYTWYEGDPRRFPVKGTTFKPQADMSLALTPYEYTTAEEIFAKENGDFEYYYGEYYNNWKVA